MSEVILCIGQTDSIDVFKSIGFKVEKVKDKDDIKKVFANLSTNTKLIYYDEDLEVIIKDIRLKYINTPYPILVSLPMKGTITNVGIEKLRNDVEKAIGIRII